ncbi:MAG: DNA starvation/stationary phase protection protein [Phenylobacterium sp.]|nr:DNA starvation/stationary phase protection protein [Phenylobacterium sp.]MBP8246444.1 DNA starvation/stationary phase protection protein [Phenylobacterium sp.]
MSMEIDIGIPIEQRAAIAEGLSHLLADTYTLYLKTHNYHWNVTGPMFQTLHTMFMTQYTELSLAVDEVAERIRALGHPAPGSYAAFARLSSIPEEESVPPSREMIANLVKGHEAVTRTARKVFPVAEAASDEPTCDLLTQRMQVSEKTAWMLRSLLEPA